MAMRVGELARRTGVGASTLRAWEARFHFLRPERSAAGHRLYEDADVERVDAVLRLMSEGLTLPAAIARVSSAGTGALPDGEGEALLFGQVLQAAGQGIWVSREGRTRYANRRMAELMGCSVDELLAIPVLKFLDPAELQVTKERGAMVRSGRRLRFTQVLHRVDGSTFLAEIDTTPLFNQAGQYEGSVAIVNDITARAEAERQSCFRAALLDAVGEAVAAATPDGQLVYVNAAAERLFGWRASDVVGKDGRRLFPAPDAEPDADAIHARLLAGERFKGELKLARVDGTEFIAHLTAAPAYDADGALLGLIAVITDQTDAHRLDRERRALELQAEMYALLGAQVLRRHMGRDTAAHPIVTEAIEGTRRLLQADVVTVLDVAPGTEELRVRDASPAMPGAGAVPTGGRSFAGYTALARKVVIVDDTRLDRRFEASPALPTISAIGAPIFGPTGICGVLTAESAAPGRFDHCAGHFVQGMANIIGTALLPR